VVEQFVHELLSPAFYLRRNIKVHYMPYTSEWSIEGKNQDRANIKANATYGTERASAYKIIEETLNLRDVRVFDAVYDDSGNRTYVLTKRKPPSPARSRPSSNRSSQTGYGRTRTAANGCAGCIMTNSIPSGPASTTADIFSLSG
jgi:hypothetical protein